MTRQRIYKTITIAVLVGAISWVPAASALTGAEIQQRIVQLLSQLQELRAKLPSATAAIPSPGLRQEIATNLYEGLRNNPQVRSLQEFLIKKGYLESGLATGNFFSRTKEAVRAYQKAKGLPTTGYFGPLSRTEYEKDLKVATPVATTPPAASSTPVISTPGIASTTVQTPAPTSSVPVAGNYRLVPRPSYDLPALARHIQDVINDIRQANNLPRLEWDDRLAAMALIHSQNQVADNVSLTNPEFLCNYPIIRHEEFAAGSLGYGLRDRLIARAIRFRYAGENIAMLSLARNLIYQYPARNPPPACPDVADFPPQEGPRSERERLYNEIIEASKNAVANLSPVQYVNREWSSGDEIARKVVDGWMNSPGHRRNILEPEYTHGGIGIAAVNDYLIITHNFLKP